MVVIGDALLHFFCTCGERGVRYTVGGELAQPSRRSTALFVGMKFTKVEQRFPPARQSFDMKMRFLESAVTRGCCAAGNPAGVTRVSLMRPPKTLRRCAFFFASLPVAPPRSPHAMSQKMAVTVAASLMHRPPRFTARMRAFQNVHLSHEININNLPDYSL